MDPYSRLQLSGRTRPPPNFINHGGFRGGLMRGGMRGGLPQYKVHRRGDDYSSSEDEEDFAEGMTNDVKSDTLDDKHENGTAKTASDDDKDQFATPDGTSETVDDPVEPGMACSAKNLYSGKEDKRGRFQWQETIPKNNKPVENAETAKYALLVRNIKVYNNPRKTLSIHSIVVQSPLLKRLLQRVLKDYPGLSLNLRRLEFTGKFEAIIHRWAKLQEEIARLDDTSENDRETKKHAELLFSVLKTEFSDVIDSSQDMMSKGVMTFEHLWTIFQPSSLVYTRQDGQDTALKLVSAKYGVDSNCTPVLWVTGKYIDWDGSRFGTNKCNIKITQFTGTRKINSMSAYPLEFHPEKEAMTQRLLERGAKFEALAGSHYKQYSGIGWKLNAFGGKDKFNIKGRVVIDTASWNRLNSNYAVFVTPMNQKEPALRTLDGEDPLSLLDDDYDTEDDGGMPADGHFVDEDDTSKRVPLTSEQKIICTALVRGYSLKTKMWLNFFTGSTSEIVWNEGAFDRLVLPPMQKELILGFTESQNCYKDSKDAFDDVIEGKGKGMILLLCGPPGVGKTLTAESCAEEMKVPLYMMSAGDLGLDPRTVESSLRDILEMCTKWNAILLLDEADVFLEQRSLHELERNKLVSIFLRVLEYSECILFLTTNRVQTFDAAFQSRIHISLEYPDLSIESRRTVWSNFLANQEHAITNSQLDQLSYMNMNGRQIKNVLKTAQLLARRKAKPLGHEHIMTVLDVTQHLHNSTQQTERERAGIYC